jgi:hypothetical protein
VFVPLFVPPPTGLCSLFNAYPQRSGLAVARLYAGLTSGRAYGALSVASINAFFTVNNGSGATDGMVMAKDDVPADHVPNDRATSLIVMPIESSRRL